MFFFFSLKPINHPGITYEGPLGLHFRNTGLCNNTGMKALSSQSVDRKSTEKGMSLTAKKQT